MNRSKIAFDLLGWKYGFNMKSYLAMVYESQYWAEDRREEYQTLRMQEIISHCARNVPYYQNLFSKLGLSPSDFRYLDDLDKLPIIRKKDVQDNFSNILAKQHGKYNPLKRSTGGTTGISFKFYNDTRSWGLNWATKIRTFSWGGYEYGKDRIAVMAGGSLLPEGRFEHKSRLWRYINNYLVLPITVMDEEIMDTYYSQLKIQGIRFLRGYPSAIYTFAKHLYGSDKTCPLVSVFTTAEMLLPHQRQKIEEVFQCKVYDTYGCGDGMGGANECEKHNGLHINIETSYMQVVGKAGKAAVDGEIGEIVLTGLHEYTMPLIRYAPGDMAVIKPGACSCGRTLPMIDKIIGRTTDLIELSNGRMLNGLSIPFETWTDKIVQFQIVQTKTDELVVRVVPKQSTTNDDLQIIKQRMEFFAGEGIRIIVQKVNEIPLPKSGKLRYVISELNNANQLR